MHIVHVIETLSLASGGPAIGCVSFAAAQALLGNQVTVVCIEYPAHAEALIHLRDLPGFDRLSFSTAPPGNFLDRLTGHSAIDVLSEALESADLMEIHGIWRPILDQAIMIARAKHVPYVVTPHGMLDPWSLQQKAWKKWPAWKLKWKNHCDKALFIRVLNSEESQLIEPLSLDAPAEIFPNGVFPTEYSDLPAPGQFYIQHPELEGRRYILFLSRLHYKKGLDYLIESFSLISGLAADVDLLIVGPDDGALYQLHQDIKRFNLEQRVHIVGPLYGRNKLAAIVDADCFCLPSRQEGFSIAIIEALAAATPVVISENCHFPEVGAVGAGHVVPLHSENIAAGLLDLLSSPEKRRRAGGAGRELILSHYTWGAIANRFTAKAKLLCQKPSDASADQSNKAA